MASQNGLLVGFCTDKRDWISAAIRWFTWWKHSHVVLISPDVLHFIESTHGKGVVLGSLTEFICRDGCELRMIPHPDPDAVWARAAGEIGKPYDWRYVYGWLVHRAWQDPAAWSCSELIAWAADLFPDEFSGRVSPRDVYLLTKPIFAP